MYESFMRRCGKSLLSVFAVFCVLVAVSSVFAQVTTGNLQGIVADQTGAVIAGASVKVTNTETNQVRETTTNDDGFYNFTSLQPGQLYLLEVTATNFAPSRVENVIVRIGTQNVTNVALGVAGAAAEVTVSGDAAILETAQAQLSQTYNAKQLTQLPINGGAIETFALLTPGVVTPGDADFTNGVGISANGNRGRSNNFQIDGQDNNDNSVAGPSLSISNVEAIGEVQVITNVFSAEFGRNSGAQINAVTKSGTNSIRGSGFYFVNNSALNTTSNTDKRRQSELRFLADNGLPEFTGLANRNKNPFGNSRFGFSLGGPLPLLNFGEGGPVVSGGKDRSFFFVTYQGDYTRGERVFSGAGGNALTFTRESALLARQLFPNAATAALTSTAVAGGPAFAQGVGQAFIIPPTIDTDGDGLIDAFANPNRGFTQGLFICNVAFTAPATCPAANRVPLNFGEVVRVVPNRAGSDQVITRLDFNMTDKDTLSVRYIYDDARFPIATGRFTAGAIFDVPSSNNNLGVTYSRNISAKFTNEARFNFSRLDVKFGDPTGDLPGPGIGFAGNRSLAGGTFSLTFGTQNNLPQSRLVDVYQLQDTLFANLGNHSLKIGADIRFQQVENFFLPNFLGTFVFQGSTPTLTSASAFSGQIPTGTPFINAAGASRTGFRATAFENFLLGRPRQISFARGNPQISTKQNDYFFFVQDDWRVRPNLTLNLGLRYEVSTTPFNPIIDDLNEREADPSTSIFNTAFPLETRTQQRLPIDKNNFAPRLGFAYSPDLLKNLGGFFKNNQTVIRGGFGLSYDPSFFNIVLNTVTAAPFAAAGTILQTPGAVGSLSFPSLPNTTAQLNLTPGTNGGDPRLFSQTRVDPNFYNPYSIGYNFGIQQELSKNSVLEIRYVGTRIIGQFQTVTGNPGVRFLNNAAQCLGLNSGAFSNGLVVGSPAVASGTATAQENACANQGFNNRPGTNGNGRVDPNFGAVRVRTNGASGTYNGLQMRYDQRFGRFLVLNANYTFSKTIDNASEIFSTGGGGQGVADPQQFFNSTSGERGLSAFHQKHNFTTNFVAELPFFKDQKGVIGKLLGGYQVSSVIRLGSGRPYTPLQAFGTYDPAFENAFFGVGALRPFNGNSSAPNGTIAFGYAAACLGLFGGPECENAAPGNFIVFNTLQPGSIGTVVANAQAAQQQARLIYNDFGLSNQFGFSLAELEAFNTFKTPFGDVGRNTFFGNNFYGVNFALFKTTNFGERYKLEFRVEAQNVLNERNFGVPDAFTEDASNGLTVSSFQNPGFNTGSVRQLRFGLRFIF
ncbi:MAG: Plug and carboxypeptidase regulatory-like domain-containing protein [Acidobacteriota bacterium]|nr:Plug and carboxypeptidase regulatory-like domain-containing protein [Acidobacteriota bacterium]